MTKLFALVLIGMLCTLGCSKSDKQIAPVQETPKPAEEKERTETRDVGEQNATEGWTQLFNGQDLKGWKPHPDDHGNWKVENGVLTGSGEGTSLLFTERGDYQDFHVRVEAKINDGGNSGLFFRNDFPNQFNGYEAKINSTHRDPLKTGSLYKGVRGSVAVKEMLVKPDEWFTLEVIAQGTRIVIKVNGTTTVEYDDTDNPHRKGHISLQQHDPASVAQFRKVEVKELAQDPAKTAKTADEREKPTFIPLRIKDVATVSSTHIFNRESLFFPTWGNHTYHDVPFMVLDPEGGKTKNTICLYSGLGAISSKMPRSVRLACDSPAKTIHFLGATGWGFPLTKKGTTSMLVTLEYADGGKEEHHLINGVHLTDWAKGPDVPESKNIGVLQVRYFSIAPKRQDDIIKAIEFQKGTDQTSPFVIAVTIETPVAQVAQRREEEPGKSSKTEDEREKQEKIAAAERARKEESEMVEGERAEAVANSPEEMSPQPDETAERSKSGVWELAHKSWLLIVLLGTLGSGALVAAWWFIRSRARGEQPNLTPVGRTSPMANQWYYIQDKQRVGPTPLDQLKRRMASGQLKPTDMVLQQGTHKWVEVGSVKELALDSTPVTQAISLQTPVTAPAESNSLGSGSLRTLRMAGAWLLRESKETAIATWAQTARLISYGKGMWRRHSLSHAVSCDQHDLGQRMYEAAVGDSELRARIAAIDEKTCSDRAQGSNKAAKAERRNLILRLAASALAQQAPPAGADAEYDKVRQTQTDVQDHLHTMSNAMRALAPKGGVGWRRILLGYAAIGCLLILPLVYARRDRDVGQGLTAPSNGEPVDARVIAKLEEDISQDKSTEKGALANDTEPLHSTLSEKAFEHELKELRLLPVLPDTPGRLAISPDGNVLASGGIGKDHRIYLHELPSGKTLHVLEGHTGDIKDVLFSPDSKALFSGSSDGTVRAWDAKTGQMSRTVVEAVTLGGVGIAMDRTKQPDVIIAQIIPGNAAAMDGRLKVGDRLTGVSNRDGKMVRAQDVTWEEFVTLLSGEAGAWVSLEVMRFGEQKPLVYEFKRAALILNQVVALALTADGKKLAVGCWHRTAEKKMVLLVRILDSGSGKELLAFQSDTEGLWGLAFSPNGTLLVSAGHKVAKVWEVATGKELAVLSGHKMVVCSAAFSPNGRTLATVGTDKSLKLWKVPTWEEQPAPSEQALAAPTTALAPVAFSPDGRLLAVGGIGSLVQVWDMATGKRLPINIPSSQGVGGVYSLAFSPDSSLLAFGSSWDSRVHLWGSTQPHSLAARVSAEAERERREPLARPAGGGEKEPIPSVDFSKLDYLNGPNGEKLQKRNSSSGARDLEARLGVRDNSPTTEQGYFDKGRFILHGRRIIWDTEEPTTKWGEDYWYNGELHGIRSCFYPSGKKRAEFPFVNGKAHGKVLLWYEDGSKNVELNYVRGELDGSLLFWYPNGKLGEETKYVSGKLHGLQFDWYDNGAKKSERNYKKGDPDGPVTMWYRNGNMKEEGSYVKGVKDGEWKSWYENGHTWGKYKWSSGILTLDKKESGIWGFLHKLDELLRTDPTATGAIQGGIANYAANGFLLQLGEPDSNKLVAAGKRSWTYKCADGEVRLLVEEGRGRVLVYNVDVFKSNNPITPILTLNQFKKQMKEIDKGLGAGMCFEYEDYIQRFGEPRSDVSAGAKQAERMWTYDFADGSAVLEVELTFANAGDKIPKRSGISVKRMREK